MKLHYSVTVYFYTTVMGVFTPTVVKLVFTTGVSSVVLKTIKMMLSNFAKSMLKMIICSLPSIILQDLANFLK